MDTEAVKEWFTLFREGDQRLRRVMCESLAWKVKALADATSKEARSMVGSTSDAEDFVTFMALAFIPPSLREEMAVKFAPMVAGIAGGLPGTTAAQRQEIRASIRRAVERIAVDSYDTESDRPHPFERDVVLGGACGPGKPPSA